MISLKNFKKESSPAPTSTRLNIIDDEAIEENREREKARPKKAAVPKTAARLAPIGTDFKEKLAKEVGSAYSGIGPSEEETPSKPPEKSSIARQAIPNIVDLKEAVEAEISAPASAEPQFKPRVRIYKKFAFIFLFLVAVMAGVILYYTFGKVRIVIIPGEEKVSNNLSFDVFDKDGDENSSTTPGKIIGAVKKIDISETQNFAATGEKILSEELAGKVTIYNSYVKNQPLVASTRLLTPDQKLFRIKNTVNVPAGGSVEVEVYPDKPGPDMEIAPTAFSIPGLWAGIQDKVYAESKEKFSYKKNVKKYVSKEDIENAKAALIKAITEKTEKDARAAYPEYEEMLYKLDQSAITFEEYAKADEEADQFTMKADAEIEAAAFKKADAVSAVRAKFASLLPAKKELVNFNENEIIFTLASFQPDQAVATINASFEGKMALKQGEQLLDPKMLVGLNKAQIEDYLKQQTDIASYELTFIPSFIKRAPRLADRIEVLIKK
jgi:hypothetical protein